MVLIELVSLQDLHCLLGLLGGRVLHEDEPKSGLRCVVQGEVHTTVTRGLAGGELANAAHQLGHHLGELLELGRSHPGEVGDDNGGVVERFVQGGVVDVILGVEIGL